MPQNLKQAYFNKLHRRLSNLYILQGDAIAISNCAELDLPKISFDTKALNTWDSIVSLAEIEEKLKPLLQCAIDHNNGDDELSSIQADVLSGVAFEAPAINQAMNKGVKKGTTPELLIIYHNNDSERCRKLKKFFSAFVYNDEIVITDFQTSITAGEVSSQRQSLLARSCIVMPVISPDFFDPNQEYIRYVRDAVEAKKRLVPVLLVRFPYSRVKVLKDYLSLPPMEKFVNEYKDEELGYTAIAEGMAPLIADCNRK